MAMEEMWSHYTIPPVRPEFAGDSPPERRVFGLCRFGPGRKILPTSRTSENRNAGGQRTPPGAVDPATIRGRPAARVAAYAHRDARTPDGPGGGGGGTQGAGPPAGV